MVLLNGEEFKIFALDTKNTILSRIASKFNTIPRYLIFSKESFDETGQFSDNITVQDLIKKSKKSKDIDFESFVGSIKNETEFEPAEIVKVWMVYNKEFEKLVSYNTIILTQYGNKFVENGYFDSLDDFNRFWDDRENFIANIEFDIEKNQIDAEKYDELYQIFDSIEEGRYYTDLRLQRVKMDLTSNLNNVSLLEVFNSIILNESVPFATCKDYYKILKNFIPNEDWALQSEDSLILKISEKVVVNKNKFQDYTDAVFTIDEKQRLKTVVRLISERGYLTKDPFLKRLTDVFHGLGEISFTKIKETEVVGLFYFPKTILNTYVFSDMVMNNKIFSSLININESEKATKRKGKDTQPWLYIYFNHPNTGVIGASIIQKVVDRSDPEMREQKSTIFVHNTPYLRIRAKGRDKKSIIEFQKMLSKLLEIYYQKHDEIVEFYEEFIPDFGTVNLPDIRLKLKEYDMIAPEVFVTNYTRACQDFRIPKIVSEKEAKKYEKKMLFPRNPPTWENAIAYPSDGINQQYYVCLNPEYPYPGLKINKLSNSEEFPYVPCCFKTDQNKSGDIYRHYYFGENLIQKEKKQQELIITNKILGQDKYGKLPEKLSKFFESIDDKLEDYKYIRMGVNRNENSFLNTVMVALHDITGILDEKNRNKLLEKTRLELASKENAPLARQCAYDYTNKLLIKKIKNLKDYFDPKLFVQMLETYFACNIYLFNDESLFLPRFAQNYYRNTIYDKCIFVYEHWGSESDHARYPQCELIIKWNSKKSTDQQLIFDHSEKIAKNVNKIFKILNNSYTLNRHVEDTFFPIDLKIKTQKIDSYGKTRCVECENNIFILTDPIPPLQVPENNEMVISECNIEQALKIIKPTSQVVVDNFTRELIGKIGNVNIIIPIKQSNILKDVRIDKSGLHYNEEQVSELAIFNLNKKLARYLVEYTFWLFSKYLNDNGIEEITDKVLANFAKKAIVIDEKFEYKNVPKKFSESSDLLKNGKLVVPNMDGAKRLMYTLKLYSMRDTLTLKDYHLKENIVNYYVDITDFDSNPTQVILQGEYSIDKWIQESKFILKLYSNIAFGYHLPYFFKNENISDSVFLAQNTDSLNKAIRISLEWNKKGYNPGFVKDNPESYNFNLYTFDNEKVKKTLVEGKNKTDYEINIIGYRVKGISFYTVLLDLEK